MMLEWILNERLVTGGLMAGAVMGPLAGWFLRRLAQRRGKPVDSLRAAAWMVAVAGPSLLVAWGVYNFVVESFGLDRLASVGINAVFFAGLGIGLGTAYCRHQRVQR